MTALVKGSGNRMEACSQTKNPGLGNQKGCSARHCIYPESWGIYWDPQHQPEDDGKREQSNTHGIRSIGQRQTSVDLWKEEDREDGQKHAPDQRSLPEPSDLNFITISIESDWKTLNNQWPDHRDSFCNEYGIWMRIKDSTKGYYRKYVEGGWRDGSVVRSTDCSSRGPEFNSQQPHGSSQPSVMGSDGLWYVWRQL